MLSGVAWRSFPANDYLIIHRIEKDDLVLILHVVHGSPNISDLFGHLVVSPFE